MLRRLRLDQLLASILFLTLASLAAVAASEGQDPAASGGRDTIPIGEAQVVRGSSSYAQHCASCHGEELEGFGPFPVLAGSVFRARWEGRPLSELYTYIHDLMPLGQGGSLSEATYADIVALVLRRNGVAAGEEEFSPDDDEVLALPIDFGG